MFIFIVNIGKKMRSVAFFSYAKSSQGFFRGGGCQLKFNRLFTGRSIDL